jgi:hypothetical protein
MMLKFNAQPAHCGGRKVSAVKSGGNDACSGRAQVTRLGGGQRRNSTMPTKRAVPLAASVPKTTLGCDKVNRKVALIALSGDGEKVDPTGARGVPLC